VGGGLHNIYAWGLSQNITKYVRNLYLNGIYELVNCKMCEGLYLLRRSRGGVWVYPSAGAG